MRPANSKFFLRSLQLRPERSRCDIRKREDEALTWANLQPSSAYVILRINSSSKLIVVLGSAPAACEVRRSSSLRLD